MHSTRSRCDVLLLLLIAIVVCVKNRWTNQDVVLGVDSRNHVLCGHLNAPMWWPRCAYVGAQMPLCWGPDAPMLGPGAPTGSCSAFTVLTLSFGQLEWHLVSRNLDWHLWDSASWDNSKKSWDQSIVVEVEWSSQKWTGPDLVHTGSVVVWNQYLRQC